MECWIVEVAGVKLLFSGAAEAFMAEVESGAGEVGAKEGVFDSVRASGVELSSAPNGLVTTRYIRLIVNMTEKTRASVVNLLMHLTK
jgi:hypothetical protein